MDRTRCGMLVAFIPDKNMVVAVTSNDGDVENAEAAAWAIVKACIKQIRGGDEAAMGDEYRKASPFQAVRWQQSQPEVLVGETWFQLVSLNEVAVGDIVAFGRDCYGARWKKRFEEDLVELPPAWGIHRATRSRWKCGHWNRRRRRSSQTSP
ncbi:MAG: hypothetical protein R3C10_11770 [Pirellulales bacterium]